MYLIAIFDDAFNDEYLDYVGVPPRLFPRLLSRAWKCTEAESCIVPMPGRVTNYGNLISILCFLFQWDFKCLPACRLFLIRVWIAIDR